MTAPRYELPGNSKVQEEVEASLRILNGMSKTFHIAQLMTRAGVIGERWSELECPLSLYLVATIPDVGVVSTSFAWLSVYDDDRRKATWRVTVPLRDYPLVKNFIKEADHGTFPTLLHIRDVPCYT